MMMQWICLLLTGSLILFCCACQERSIPNVTSADVLKAMLSEAAVIDGKLYQMRTGDESERISEELFKALYGETAVSIWKRSDTTVEDGAIYLSEIMHPFELAVFRCIGEDEMWGDAGVIGICASRLESIKKAWKGSAYEKIADQGIVTYCETYVLLVIAEDAESIINAAKRRIREK